MTTLFASKGYTNVALIARRAEQLNVEGKAIERAVGSHINVKTYAVDVVDTDALVKALDDTEKEFGKPNCVFYNAARVLPSALLTHDVKEIDYDFKVSVCSDNRLQKRLSFVRCSRSTSRPYTSWCRSLCPTSLTWPSQPSQRSRPLE